MNLLICVFVLQWSPPPLRHLKGWKLNFLPIFDLTFLFWPHLLFLSPPQFSPVSDLMSAKVPICNQSKYPLYKNDLTEGQYFRRQKQSFSSGKCQEFQNASHPKKKTDSENAPGLFSTEMSAVADGEAGGWMPSCWCQLVCCDFQMSSDAVCIGHLCVNNVLLWHAQRHKLHYLLWCTINEQSWVPF